MAVNMVATSVNKRAVKFTYEVLIDSIMASLEKNADKNGVPMRASDPIEKQVEIVGRE